MKGREKKKLLLMMFIVALAISLASIVVYQLFQPHYEPVTEVEYPGSLINISIPSTTPDQSLEPAPYPALGLFPKPGAKMCYLLPVSP
ncbi:MAG: hypothetical protein U9O85_10005 [Euryarchaeota archaeon]|nr:hypothetical protein [Euryarchaeota archaeon]